MALRSRVGLWRVCSFEVIGALCTEVPIPIAIWLDRMMHLGNCGVGTFSRPYGSAYDSFAWGCPSEESVHSCTMLSSRLFFYPFVGPFYSVNVPAISVWWISVIFIYCPSHRWVCRVAICFIGNFWWGMVWKVLFFKSFVIIFGVKDWFTSIDEGINFGLYKCFQGWFISHYWL